jgi:hypothetical protein
MAKIVLLLLAATLAAPGEELRLRAGVARREITPKAFLEMAGYASRKCGPANGTHDPLMAKALVLEAGESRMAIVTLDLIGLISERLPKQVSAKLGIPVVLLASSHTHSGPNFPRGISTGGADSVAYLEETEQKIFDAIQEAAGALTPARLEVGRGSLQLGYNRLLKREDGRARALFDNLDRVPYGPVDPEFTLLRVVDEAGAPKALVVHYATHAVVLGPTNCKYSADYPGVLQAKVEAGMKGVQCMFVQGGAGDINPLFQGRTGEEERDFGLVAKLGGLLADAVLRTELKPASPMRYPIQATSEVLQVADRWEKGKSLEVGITTVLINREIAIAAMPGEPMHKLQTSWKQNANVPYPLFYGYTYSAGGTWPGYIPDLRSAAYGGYGADASTKVEIGAGERLLQRHLIHLYGLLGMWREQQGKP